VKAGRAARSVKLMVMVANDSMDAVPETVALSAEPAGIVTMSKTTISTTVPGKKSANQKAKTKRESFTVLVPPTASGNVTVKASLGALSASSTLQIQAAKK